MIRSCSRLSISALFVMLFFALMGAPSKSFSKDLESRHLFKIERSKNANIVQYDVQLTPDGKLDPKEPVIAYWVRLAEDGRRRDLSFIQKRWAYGFETKHDAKGNFTTMKMVAKIGRKIRVYEVGGVYRGEIRICGQPAFIEKVFITSIERGFFPKVESIELYGKDAKTGEDRYEKIRP